MAEFYSETKQRNRDFSDRYRNCIILKDIKTNDVLISTREIPKIPHNTLDTYHTIAPNEEGRLDLIADKYYDNPLMWWVIAQANDIYDPLTRPISGDIIRIPSITTLYSVSELL